MAKATCSEESDLTHSCFVGTGLVQRTVKTQYNSLYKGRLLLMLFREVTPVGTSEASEDVLCLLIEQDDPQKKSRPNSPYCSVPQDLSFTLLHLIVI